MAIFFARHRPECCCLCGTASNLTREHKIKAAAIRGEFGRSQMLVGKFGDSDKPMKSAQGANADALKFASRICGECNSARTQPADREFDRLNALARTLLAAGSDPRLAFGDVRYAIGSEAYLNVFRYFAKLLCCHIADVGGPRPIHLSNFAIGRRTQNCVFLNIDRDWSYDQVAMKIGEHSYAAHGGLVIYCSKNLREVSAFHSTISIGSLRFTFFSRLNRLERIALRVGHSNFYTWCLQKGAAALAQPISAADRLRLGFPAGQEGGSLDA